MVEQKTNIHKAPMVEEPTQRGGYWRHLELGGKNIGVRIEELLPGWTSSLHHYHTQEEEHVLVLEGAATLHLGDERKPLVAGDHVWFEAGIAQAHHIENTSDAPFRFLVFGERKDGDEVIYPPHPSQP